jgi:predicted PurR-regulated permease PerM
MNSRPWSPAARYFTLALVLLFIIFIVWQARALFWALIVGGLIAYILYPFVLLLQQQFRLKRKLASNIIFFFSLALMIALPVIIVPVLSLQTKEITTDLDTTLTQAQQYLAVPVHLGGYSIDLGNIIPQVKEALFSFISSTPQNTLLLIRNTSRGTLWGLIIIVSVYFFMTEWENIREGMIRIAPEEHQQDVRLLYGQIRQVWMAYLRGQITLMIIVAIVFTIVWTIIGLPGSLYLGFLAGLLSIIPDVGPFAATALALAVALLEGSTWLPINNFLFGLLVVGLYIVLINIKNIWLRPYILGRSVNMHEAIVFVAIVGAVIFTGIIGAFIVVPVLASIGVIWRYLHARMLGLPPFEFEKEPASSPNLEPITSTSPVSRSVQGRTRRKSSKI